MLHANPHETPSHVAVALAGGEHGVHEDEPRACDAAVCSGMCVDLASDPSNCGACGRVCGAMEVFDTLRGCVPATECFERGAGETCDFLATRCDAGLICCQHCSGVGCAPDMTCEAPVCDAEPAIDECGNNLLAP